MECEVCGKNHNQAVTVIEKPTRKSIRLSLCASCQLVMMGVLP